MIMLYNLSYTANKEETRTITIHLWFSVSHLDNTAYE